MLFDIKNLHVSVGGKEILKGFNLSVNEGEVHAIMGPNGTGRALWQPPSPEEKVTKSQKVRFGSKVRISWR